MTVYVDMDGVIANFFGKLEEIHGVDHWKNIKNIETSLAGIANTSFFNDIEPYPESADIISLVKKVSKGDWGICSTPLRNDHYNSAYWKRIWLERHGWMPEDLEKCIFTFDKPAVAISRISGKPNILIDDKISNIKAWEAKGGIGIRFQCNEDDIEYLEECLLEGGVT